MDVESSSGNKERTYTEGENRILWRKFGPVNERVTNLVALL
jgi:hypothetical protein